MSHALLEVHDLTVAYGAHTALKDVSFDVGQGEVIAVVGPNGAGKSTLFKALVGLVDYRGSVMFGGSNCHHGHDHHTVAYVPQHAGVDRDFPIDVKTIVQAGRRPFARSWGWPTRSDRALADDALRRVGLDGFGRRPVRALSGGELQRVFLARALAQGADVLLLDEAMSGVDEPSTGSLLNLFDELADAGLSILVSTHDLALARRRFNRCLAVNGRLVDDGPPSRSLAADHLEMTFGSGVHRSLPFAPTSQTPPDASIREG